MALAAAVIYFMAMFATHQHVNSYFNNLGIESGGLVFQILVLTLSATYVYLGAGKWNVDTYWFSYSNHDYPRR